MSNPASPKVNKPAHKAIDHPTAPPPQAVALHHKRKRITGTQVPKTEQVHLPTQRAARILAVAAGRK